MGDPKHQPPNGPKQGGAAVDDEDPDHGPMDGLVMPVGPAQPYDIEKVESDRAKSIGPRITNQGKPT